MIAPMSGIGRRSLLAGGAATAGAVAFARPTIALAAAKPLKIGMVTSLSGPFTSLGGSMRAGMQLFLSEKATGLPDGRSN